MKFSELESLCQYVADDTGNFWPINENQFAIVRRGCFNIFRNRSAFVVFDVVGHQVVVAVNSYLDVWLTEEECIELAKDGFNECRGTYNSLSFTRGD
jgi:hypothetical protein